MQVTISLLPASLSLVHIPRSRLHQLSRPVLKQILQPSPTFLNITCNEVELSLFADENVLEDFEPIARKDRRRQRSASSGRNSASRSRDIDPVEVSYERWSVLQVDSHSDQLDNSGARVNEVSAPLAAAGISILYQSSYMSDFILVKESRLQETMSLLADAGFDIYTGSDTSPINPVRTKDRSSVHDFRIPTPTASMTRARSATDPSSPKPTLESILDQHDSSAKVVTPPRKKSSSPTAGEVRLLASDLACVGLSEELGADHWGLKIVKLVAFPELISSPAPPPYVPHVPVSPSIVTRSIYPLRKATTPLFDFSPPTVDLLARNTSPTPSGSSSTSESSSEDDGYFSHSPKTKSSSSIVTSASRSETDLREPLAVPSPYKHLSRHIMQPLSSITPTTCSSIKVDPTGVTRKPRVPFFSYTRTAEGSSLTADVYILAALFPPPERDMIICSGELDAADDRVASHPVDDLSDDEDFEEGSIFSCLQIDLQRFGLDKYGLVNRFSKVLEENKINHMYSSSFKTANLLVDKKHARRAQALLCGC